MSRFTYGISSGKEDLGKRYLSIQIFHDEDMSSVEDELRKGDFERLVISTGGMENLEFLSDCMPQGPKRLLIQGGIESFSGLEKLTNLVSLQCDLVMEKPYPDFSRLVNLEKCFLVWDRKYDVKGYHHGLFTLKKLSDLTLRYWAKPDCQEIAHLKQLQSLDLRQGAVTSIDGLQNCTGLRNLHLSYLPKLVDIGCLDNMPKLESLHIQNCTNIGDYGPVARLKNLRSIHLEKVNARFADLNWIGHMPHLEKVRLSCEIADIDWNILFNHPSIKDVGMSSHEGYSVPDSEILKLAESARRKLSNFSRIGTKKKPSFVFVLE